jgi:tetratricopeptide (TPR) repeat protein
MARLAHPNVVHVYEIGEFGDQVFIAMEFVRGQSLREWMQEPRSWPAVLDVFSQAGRGLAAAHAAAIVHCDFKPENVLLGEDGRARVLDFGLAQPGTRLPSPGTTADATSLETSPPRGGTPGYMPPEQLGGGQVDARSDQFSFCIALYEALFGELPSVTPLKSSTGLNTSRRPRGRGRSLRPPKWLHDVLMRGLRVQPTERFPTMEALLVALDRGKHRGRRVGIIAGSLVAAAAVGLYLGVRNLGPTVDRCSGGEQQVAQVWNEARKTAAEQSFARLGPVMLEQVWRPAAATLDHYADGWQLAHHGACEAHLRGETSGLLLDRRMSCLRQRLAALDETVTVLLEVEPDAAVRAREIAVTLPDLAHCSDLAALAADIPPPENPEVRARVEHVRDGLERAAALRRSGRRAQAETLNSNLTAEAEQTGYRPVLAEALLEDTRLSTSGYKDRSPQTAMRAFLVAVEAGSDELAAEALATYIYIKGLEASSGTNALEYVPLANAFIERLPAPDPMRGLLLNNVGSVYIATGQPRLAESSLRQALATKERVYGPRHVEIVSSLVNLAMISEDETERQVSVQRAYDILEAEFGPAHPATINVLITMARQDPDPRHAEATLARGCEQVAASTPDDIVMRVTCMAHLAEYAADSGHTEIARAAWNEAGSLARLDTTGDSVPFWLTLLIHGNMALGHGGTPEAIAALQSRLTGESGEEWWIQGHLAQLRLCLGELLNAAGRPAEAVPVLESAIEGYTSMVSASFQQSPARDLSRARLALAESVAALGSDPGPGLAALDAAEAWYRAGGEAYAWRMPELAALRRRLAKP